MANIEEAGPSQQLPNPFVDEPTRILLEKYLKILKDFVASNDQVFKLQGNLSSEERGIVVRICSLMGLGTRFSGSGNERKICVYIKEIEEASQAVMSKKRKDRDESSTSQVQDPIVDELNRIWISQILGNFLASTDEVYNFETKLSSEERGLVYQFCQKMGLIYTLSWHGIKQKVSIHKTKKDVDSTALLESLPHVTFSEESNQVARLKESHKKEEAEPPQHQNFIVIESKRVQISRILENFLASNDEVYNFEDELSTKELAIVQQLAQKMGLSCTFSGRGIKFKTSVQKIKKEVDTTTVLDSRPHITFSEGSNLVNKEELEPPQHQNPIINESTRIQISQTLENFLASKDKVYKFVVKLSPEECDAARLLSQKMGFRVRISGHGNKQKLYVYKIKNKNGTTGGTTGTTTRLESLRHFNFSEESKQLLVGLAMHYPPGDEEFWGDMIGTIRDTTDKTEQKEDDFFGRPNMSNAEVTKKLEDLAARMRNPCDLEPIFTRRSKLPIASFKDVITSTVESRQVVVVCSETGCGKTTQVPQFILDHVWGKGEVCKIVCTQPRRISVTLVSERISSERGETIGNNVGYKIWLESRGGRQSSIIVCTTSVLLKVLASKGSCWSKTLSVKEEFSGITHIIMDEIHERDQYSDLMLAIFREMLPSYPHLRLVLMSTTVDAARFSQYFGDCPVIHVPGFTNRVKTYYLEDVLSIVKFGEDNHLDNNHELSQEEKLYLDKAINLAWSNNSWCPLIEFVYSEGSPKVFNYQHSKTGLTPLMVFAGKGKVSDVCKLLSLGANCHLRAKDGTTALEIAEKKKQQVAAEMLKKHMDNDFSNEEGVKLLDKYLATVDSELVDVVLIEQLIRKICSDSKDGSILIFLPDWDEICRTYERLLASPFFNDTAKFRVIYLHSMAPSIGQKVFMRPPHGCRKIVLSTNVAENAVTIDDIVYVIDTGRIKEKSYDPYKNLLTLQSSWISKASAKQREGLAGRCQPGICYHLYSKFQAASLPKFRVPEIKRMPIEELCLQVKLFDPSRKIEEFLSKTLNPPVFESIQNAIAVLKIIGALSPDEKLTRLGEKFGYLPVHPATSRMLLFSILMNCLDPALTLACASEYSDPFMLPILPDEKERAAAARSELASLYGGCSHQFAVIAAFECWQNSSRMGLEARFCSQYFVCQNTMHMVSAMRKKLATVLFQNGLIRDDVSCYSLNAHDLGILHAALVAWRYPMVGKLCVDNRNVKNVFVKTESGDKVCLDCQSPNFKLLSQKRFDCSLVVYDEITRGDEGMSIRNYTVVGLLPLLLFSRDIVVAPAKDCKAGDKFMSSDNIVRVIIDRWLNFESTALDVSHMYNLRERLSAAISYKVTRSTGGLPPTLGATMDALACILSCDGLSGILQTSDDADTLATGANAFKLGKQAKWTEQAIVNPSVQSNQKAPICFACSIPTEENDMIPDGSCTGLINHDTLPSSGISISTSKGIENPCDPKNHNIAIGSACLIPTKHKAKNPEESHTELINHDTSMTDVPSSEDSISASKCTENPSDSNSQKSPTVSHYQKVAVGWTFPEVGWMKANVDGSCKEEGRLPGCGGVFRDSTGSWKFGFVQNLGAYFSGVFPDEKIHRSTLMTELCGILTALKLAREKGISQLWIESDSAFAVKFSNDSSNVLNDTPCDSVIQSIHELMRENWTVRISHCYREGNQVADWLANYAHSTEPGVHVLDVPPPECIKYLTEDIAGLFRNRVVLERKVLLD
ncbi:DExH-box ATP-dependent RNA helicase DExH6-like isoform X2 [Gastrolobium bilobum]|uniref:DExH-box ATP-dependent RNA helicase DExH6-like isoform X2 n=1 Tax=Gastrolobium bilobum TaxID=150636 RepID=UPI002AB12861|nr:DExH-box ATP-dependent RNA helicase DExH6-like isoform X2 [Gastrolobium bilobum]